MITVQEFINENRELIDRIIRERHMGYTPEDDNDREVWIMNDEGLYNLAIAENVNVYE